VLKRYAGPVGGGCCWDCGEKAARTAARERECQEWRDADGCWWSMDVFFRCRFSWLRLMQDNLFCLSLGFYTDLSCVYEHKQHNQEKSNNGVFGPACMTWRRFCNLQLGCRRHAAGPLPAYDRVSPCQLKCIRNGRRNFTMKFRNAAGRRVT
jgi:hypothetical protein